LSGGGDWQGGHDKGTDSGWPAAWYDKLVEPHPLKNQIAERLRVYQGKKDW